MSDEIARAAPPPAVGHATHEVYNQPGDLTDYDPFNGDRALCDAVAAFGADWAGDRLTRAAAWVGSAEVQTLARQANHHVPELHTHDRFGHRIDLIELHPAWHELMRRCFSTETHSLAWAAGCPCRARRLVLSLEPG